MAFTRTEDSPFDDTSVLAEDYIPDKVLGRDQELAEIHEVLQQIVDREQPVNAFIYGISGTGKTVSIKYKRQELIEALEQYDDVHATFVYQNCESLSSSYQAAIAIANSYLEDPEYDYLNTILDIERNRLPSSGLPKERVYDILFDLFDHLTYRYTEYRPQIEQVLNGEELEIDADIDVDDLLGIGEGELSESERTEILDKIHNKYDIRRPSEVRDYVTVILDEVDRIGSRDELLYEIPRSRTNERVSSVYPSVIGISNDIGYKEKIQSKTDSSLRLKEITFKKYDIDELSEILSQRAEKAFKSEAYEEQEIVSSAAAFARKQGGDARYAIDLLHKSGMKAKRDGSSVVREEHVISAHEEKERDRVYEVTEDLSDQEKIVLAAVMYHDLLDETPITRKDMYQSYQRYSQQILEDTNGSRRVADYLKKMSQLGLLDRRDAYKGPGESGFKYQLDKVDYNMIIQILGDSVPSTDAENLLPGELIDAFERLADSEGEGQQTRFESFN